MPHSENSAPILIVHTGGLGDLVLASRLIEGLDKRYPHKPIVLIVRQPFASVPALFPTRPRHVLALEFDPHFEQTPSEALHVKLAELKAVLASHQPDMMIAADLEPTWLSWFLTSSFPAVRALGMTVNGPPRGLLTALLQDFGVAARQLEMPGGHFPKHEVARYSAILRQAGGERCEVEAWGRPVPDSTLLRRLGIEPGKYIACFPTGAASTVIKRWNPTHYRTVLSGKLREDMKLLLTGEESERAAMEEFRAAFGEDARYVSIFSGSANDISNLATLVANARVYIGNDTGPVHLAQAYGVPGVVVFGGGTWPHYAPWANGSIGVLRPMGCFGCRWDCAYGRALCLEEIPVAMVSDAFERALGRARPPSVMGAPDSAARQIEQRLAAEAHRRKQCEQKNLFDLSVESHGDSLQALDEAEGHYLQEISQH